MGMFLQQTIDGLEIGAVYASLALALVLIHRATGLVNFAQGEMAMFSTYVTFSLCQAGLAIYAAAPIAVAVSFAAGLVIERVLFRPLQTAEPLTIVVAMLGLFLGFNALAGLIWSYQVQRLPSLFPTASLHVGRAAVGLGSIGTLLALIVVCGALYLLINRTRLGLMMRAAASNAESSRLMGIKVGAMFGVGWGLAAALGCVAGVLVTPHLFLDPNAMQGVIIFAIAAAVVGGLDSPLGAVVAGLAIGVAEALAGAYLVGAELRVLVPLVLIFAILLLRPNGLFGVARAARL
jgi:branched-chain amino acid transport system permease protein